MNQRDWFLFIAMGLIIGALSGCGDKDKNPPDDGDKGRIHSSSQVSEFCGVQLDPRCLQDILRTTDPVVCRSAEDVLLLVETLCH